MLTDRKVHPLVFRYVFFELVKNFFGSCILIIFVLFIFQCLRLAEFLIVNHVSFLNLCTMCFYLLISFLPYAFPMAFLITVLSSFSRMSIESEWIAFKALGISQWALSLPVFVFSMIIAAFSLGLNLEWVPWGEFQLKAQQKKIAETRSVSLLQEGAFTTGFFDLLVFAESVDRSENRLHRVFIQDARDESHPLVYVAKEAQLLGVTSIDPSNRLNFLLKLMHGTLYRSLFSKTGDEKIDFENYSLFFPQKGSSSVNRKRTMFSWKELALEIDRHDPNSDPGRAFRAEYWRRFYSSISCFLFALLGVGLGSYRSRTPRSGALLSGLLVLFLYWLMQSIGIELSVSGWMPAFLGLALPILILTPFAGYRFWRSCQ